MSQAPEAQAQAQSAAHKRNRNRRQVALRSYALIAALASTLSLTACGGGGSADVVTFDIGVAVGGQPLSGVQVTAGASQTISIIAGQSIELDASEPVAWTLEVGGSTVTGSGTTVYYAGATITQTAVSDSRIVVDTSAAFPLVAPVPITFIATSTLDSAQVATVNVLITN
ncbi:MAG: hypothetical protein JF606_28365 [Burkholderiales bacterium]|jgi:hypothetical protein|nr:hypothetical protein [Burkholderiales bacterium]